VLLFGSFAHGTERDESDYDLIVVARRFGGLPLTRREIGLRELFYAVGGSAPMDLICVTPEEFESARLKPTLIAAVVDDAIDLLPQPTTSAP
jgi:predicted nucleotidyltransferase